MPQPPEVRKYVAREPARRLACDHCRELADQAYQVFGKGLAEQVHQGITTRRAFTAGPTVTGMLEAGTARARPHSRIISTCSGLVWLRGTTFSKHERAKSAPTASSPLRSASLPISRTADSMSAPVKPSEHFANS